MSYQCLSDKNAGRLEAKLDVIAERIGEISITIAKQHETLLDHTRRSTALEAQIKPIQTHVDMVAGALKLLGGIALLAGIWESLHVVFH